MWNGSNGSVMANFYDFNEEIDTLSSNTTNFRQQNSSTMQQQTNDSIATASTTLNMTASSISSNVTSTVMLHLSICFYKFYFIIVIYLYFSQLLQQIIAQLISRHRSLVFRCRRIERKRRRLLKQLLSQSMEFFSLPSNLILVDQEGRQINYISF